MHDPSRSAVSDSTVSTGRLMAASPSRIFEAFERPEILAEWWGPEGFTNTFGSFEFRLGGRWVFVMHGPNGADYPNESVFRVIEPAERIVIEHVVNPRFILTVSLVSEGEGKTRLLWIQDFGSAELAARMRPIGEVANEQVLDRLEAVLAGWDRKHRDLFQADDAE